MSQLVSLLSNPKTCKYSKSTKKIALSKVTYSHAFLSVNGILQSVIFAGIMMLLRVGDTIAMRGRRSRRGREQLLNNEIETLRLKGEKVGLRSQQSIDICRR